MATKEAVFSLRVDTGDSVNDVNSFDKAVKSLDKSLQDTSKTASASTGLDSFDAKLKEINDRVNGGGLTMRELTRAMKEYQTVAIQSGVQTPVGMDALKNASQLKDKIGDLKAQTTALSSDFVGLDTALAGVETGAAVFQGMQSTMALAGVENEALVQTMVKLQAVQGLVNSVQLIAKNLNSDAILGIKIRSALEVQEGEKAVASITMRTIAEKSYQMVVGTSTGAVKGLRLALASTGIGAIIVGLGLVVAYWDDIKASISGVSAESQKLQATTKAKGEQLQKDLDVLGMQESSLKLQGKSEKDIIKLRQIKINDLIENIKLEIKQAEYKKKVEIAAAKRNQEYARLYARIELETLALTLRATAAPIDLMILGINKALQLLGKSESQLKPLNSYITDMTKSGADMFASFMFDPEAVAKENDTALNELKTSLTKMRNERDSNILAMNEIDLKASENSHKNQAKTAEELAKQKLDIIKQSMERESKAIEETEDLKIKRMKEGSEKEIAILNDQYGDWRDELLKGAVQKELDALDEKFSSGKIKEEEYRSEIQTIMADAVNKLTDAEKALVIEKELDLQDSILFVQKNAQEIEVMRLAEKEKKKLALLDGFKSQMNSKYEEDLHQFENAQKEKSIQLGDALAENVITEAEYMAGQLKLEEEYSKKVVALNKEKNNAIKEQERKTREEQMQGFMDGLDTAQKVLDQVKIANDLMNEIGNARILATNKQKDEDLAKLEENKKAELNIEGMSAEQKKVIEEDYNNQKYKIQIKAYEEEDKIKRAQFNRSKAIKLAQIGIDTASAIAKGIAEFGPPPSPMGIVAIASASAIGLTQALAVKNSKYQSGSMPQAPSISTGGSSAGASGSTFMVGSSGTSTTGLPGANQTNNATNPVQVFVLENDISSTQNKVALQEKKSSF